MDDLVYVDDLTKHSDQVMSISKVGVIALKGVGIPYSVPISSTPYKTAFTTPIFSPARLISAAKGGETLPYPDSNRPLPRGFGVKKILTDYLSIDTRGKNSISNLERSDSSSSIVREASTSQTGIGSSQCSSDSISPQIRIQDSVWEE